MAKHYDGVIPEGSIMRIEVDNDELPNIYFIDNNMTIEKNTLLQLEKKVAKIERVEKINENRYTAYAVWQNSLAITSNTIHKSISM